MVTLIIDLIDCCYILDFIFACERSIIGFGILIIPFILPINKKEWNYENLKRNRKDH